MVRPLPRWVMALFGIELWSGASLCGWGAWVLSRPGALTDLPSYDPISRYIPENAWGYVAVTAGAAQIAARLAGGTVPRWLATFAVMVVLKCLAVSNLVSPQPGPASMIECGMAFADIAVLVALIFL